MKKKFLTIALSFTMLLTACGSTSPEVSTAASTDTQQTESSVDTGSDTKDTAKAESSAASDEQNATGETTVSSPDQVAKAPSELTNESLGAVSFIPDGNAYQFIYGNTVLQAYFQREGVIAGNGKVVIHKVSDQSVVEELDLQKEGIFEVGKVDSYVDRLGWSGGTHAFFHLSKVLDAGETYYLTLEEGAFTSADGSIRSKEITDDSLCKFTVTKYGIKAATPSGSSVYVDDTLTADIYLYQPAVVAKVENFDENRVRFNEKEFTQSGKLEIAIHQIGEDPFTVNFYDEDDNLLGSATLSYTASIRPEETESLPSAPVGNL